MTTRQQQNNNQRSQQENQGPAYEYRGFDDWVEIFRSGEQTDSQGRIAVFTNADLDSMVENHRPSPIVIGHPKTDSPAWGWSEGLKRVDSKLYGKYKDVVTSFEKMVENKQFPERSIKIEQLDNGGYRLVHTGFLGAVAPAVEGMERMAFSQNQVSGECFEFSGEWRITGKFARLFRNLKNHLISEKGQEVADSVIPEWELQSVSDAVAEKRIEEREEGAFSQQNQGVSNVAEFTQEQLDQAVQDASEKGKTAGQKAAQQAFSAQVAADKQLSDATAFVSKLVSEQKLTPAQAIGLPEFMAQLGAGDAEFTFSSGEGAAQQTIKQSPFQYFSGFLNGLNRHGLLDSLEDDGGPTHIASNEYAGPAGTVYEENSVKADKQAREYMSKHKGVSYIEAADIVQRGE